MSQPPNYPGDPNQGPNPYGQQPQGPGPQGPQPGQPGGFPPPPQNPYGQPPQGQPQPPQPGFGGQPNYGQQQPGFGGQPQPGYPGGEQPQGGYPPPPGGFPPAGGYPGGGFGQPAFGGAPFSIGEGFSWAWNKFTKNAVPLVVSSLVYALIIGVVLGIGMAALFGSGSTTEVTDAYGNTTSVTTPSTGGFVVYGICILAVVVVAFLTQIAFLSGVLDIADGKEVSIGSFFKPRNLGAAAVTAIVLGLATSIGFMLCVIPGLLVMYFGIFAIQYSVDRGLSLGDAFKASMEVTKNNVGQVLLLLLVIYALSFVGSLACYVGLLVAMPVASLLQVYAGRKLSGGQVAPATP